ncbi:site-specific DNA-methyltransferase [uncultured Ruthenibacterium sp.]|uniref:DNA-methyltransferase n=1 Tax=uncultured Ruthenibacterium sp. TaxID=1905347 RepID=UPI00349E6EDD
MAGYSTKLGTCMQGDSLDVLRTLPDHSIDLIVTSPPFSLQRHKSYGEVEQNQYVDWLLQFGAAAYDKLKDTGSFVVDIGGAYQKGQPIRSLYPFRFMLRMCDELGYCLAQDFYWHNPSALPTPIEWVNKRKLRCKTSVNTVWWFSKTNQPKSDIRNVLVPYSARMQDWIDRPQDFVKKEGTLRPSGHKMSIKSWAKDNGGAIPPNLLQISNSDSNSPYLRYCKQLGIKGHPARFPVKLPEFFIKMLTDENDLVMDLFSGSNTTGQAAENLGRRWLSVDINLEYVASSVFRFMDDVEQAEKNFHAIMAQKELYL